MRTLQYIATVFVVGLIALFATLAVWRLMGAPGETAAQQNQSIQPFTPTPDCATALRDYKDRVAPILSEWHDALQLAIQSPRMSLAPQIATLQAINRRVNEIKPDLCVILAHMSLTESMNESVDGLLAFLGQKPEEEQSAHFEKATRAMDEYSKALEGRLPTPTPNPSTKALTSKIRLICPDCDSAGIPIRVWSDVKATRIGCEIAKGQDRSAKIIARDVDRPMLLVQTTYCTGWIADTLAESAP